MTTQNDTQNIVVPEAPPIPGLTFRHWRGRSDYAHMKSIFDDCKGVDGNETTWTVEEIARNLENQPHSHLPTDMIFAEVDGQPIGFGRVGSYQEDEGTRVYFMRGFVIPAWRRKGLGTAILKHSERRIREIAARHPDETPKFFQGEHNDKEAGIAALLKANGYQEVRWGYLLTRPVSDPIQPAPLPDGVQVHPATREQARQIWDALQDAFSESWGFVPGTEHNYQNWLADPTFDPSLWQVAWDGDEVAGMVLNFVSKDENEEYGRRRGWTDPICVRKPWRRRGLARALLAQSLLMFRAMDFDDTALGVDTHNPNHALDLYESAGYKVVRKGTVCRKPVE